VWQAPLERDGLISLKQDATDRRRRHVKLTRKGRLRFAAAQSLLPVINR
jgi:DNA-binding MarR family transcriptional regulator